MTDKLCPSCGKLARFITQAGPNKVIVRHAAKRYQDCVIEGDGVTAGGGHVEHHVTGKALKEEALDDHERAKVKPLYLAREYVRKLFERRKKLYGDAARVSADDVREYCDFNDIERGPWMGAVFRARDGWVWDGITHSKDPIQHGAMLKLWRLAG